MSNSPKPLDPCRRVLLPAQDRARYFSGGPYLVVSTRLAPVPDLGTATIFADAGAEDVRLFFSGAARAGDFTEARLLPSDVLAIVATAADGAPLRALWAERGQEQPPLIVVATMGEALGPVLACARAQIAAATARTAELQRALVATRGEFEETRSAMQGVMRTLSHRYATKMNLVAAIGPAPEKTVTLTAPDALKRVFSAGTENLTCLALHIVALEPGARVFLKVLLIGAESGRVLGEWRRPGEALLDGWNTFDLPTPLAAVRETVAVEVSLDGGADGAITFSLGEGGEDPFAIRIWTADAGGRFPHAKDWIWTAQGATRPAAGTVTLIDSGSFARVERHGRIEAMPESPDGTVASYRVRGGTSLLRLQSLSIRDAEGVCVELGQGFGDLKDARFELIVHAGDQGISSGWRSFEGNALKLGLSLPAALPDVVDLVLRIEDGERFGSEYALLVVRQVEVIAGKRGDLGIGLQAMQIEFPGLAPPDEHSIASHFAGIKAVNYSETEKYALFEVALDGVSFGGRIEKSVKFKASISKGRLSLEFRQGKNWPRIFRAWPSREQDRFGDVFRVAQAESGLMIAGDVAPGADRDLLAALCSLMPTVVTAGIHTLPSAAKRLPEWLEAARAFAAAAAQTFDEPLA